MGQELGKSRVVIDSRVLIIIRTLLHTKDGKIIVTHFRSATLDHKVIVGKYHGAGVVKRSFWE
eukprot:1295568-Heterocapsa_arctica.AAC.1